MSAPADWTRLPLGGDGRSLVEASAGTGKTWTIAVLYLRLLLEDGRMPSQIIVSTFTNAAAAELSQRLRGKLQWALAVAAAHAADEGAVAAADEAADRAWLRGRWCGRPEHVQADVRRLQAALAEFDFAPISTLHALCSRILVEHPFAAGAPFRAREVIDAKALHADLADDLWRLISQGDETDELVRMGRALELKRSTLENHVPILVQPDVEVLHAPSTPMVERIESVVGDLTAWIGRLRAVLQEPGLLQANGGLRKAWTALLETSTLPQPDFDAVVGDHYSALRDAGQLKGVNKAGQQRQDVVQLATQSAGIVHGLSDTEVDLLTNLPLRRFLAAAQRWCLAAMRARLDAANQSSFDQLLHVVHDALQARDGQRALADALFAAWPVALVDEFQDTDPVQFGILDAIYRNARGAPRGRLVMIGDPKQAIYRFRGGDVQTYERASADVPASDRLTLDTNFRSSRSYVDAINAFYRATGTRLGPKESETPIAYQPVKASSRQDDAPLRATRSGDPIRQPLVLHELQSSEGIHDLEAHALRACAGQIVHALSDDGYCIGKHRLKPGNIAVLLPTNGQVAHLSTLLKARGVPCVATSRQSVFETDTARELRLILYAALHAEDASALRAALASRLWGASLGRLQQLRHDPVGWDREVARFHALRAQLHGKGPLAVVEALLERHAPRLLQTVAGERMLTDLRHLGELLQAAWVECGGGERLMAWLAEQMEGHSGSEDAADERALRLESDAARVQLMTLHASKGLEFGVVFLPMMWRHGGARSGGVDLLSNDEGTARYLVKGPARKQVQLQEYEERYRILYVALTRAIHACHVFTLAEDVPEKRTIRGKPPLNELELSLLRAPASGEPSPIEHRSGWKQHPDATWSATDAGVRSRQARPLPAAPRGPLPMRHSFTTLSRGHQAAGVTEEGAAEDERLVDIGYQPGTGRTDPGADAVAVPAVSSVHPELDALAMVAGADFGNAVHAIFENRVPQVSLLQQQAGVRTALEAHGVRPREGEPGVLVEALSRRLQTVLETPLGGADGPRLIELPAAQMRVEMEFNYLLDGASMRALRRVCEVHGEQDLVPAREQILAGLMNGKIDLLFAHAGRFHVLDYKSNRLPASGRRTSLEDYAPAALERAMTAAGYRLQALLYTVAVDRYLRERLGPAYRRAQHLGDCWYLYIRATGLTLPDGTACGVWRHRFDDALLDAVQGVLATQQGKPA